jgi:HAD superfamily hydrolase (TIGR01662 family)
VAVKTIVFDVGGVFKDSRKAMHDSFAKAFHDHGMKLECGATTIWRLRGLEGFNDSIAATRALLATHGKGLEHLINKPRGEAELIKIIADAGLDPARVSRLRDEYRKYFYAPESAKGVRLFDGVEEGLERLAKKYTLGVVTNSLDAAVQRDVGHLLKSFAFVATDARKPDPAAYLKALKKRHIKPAEAVYVGDSASDIVMARFAGSKSVALLSGMGLEKHLRAARPNYVFEDFKEFTEYALNSGFDKSKA